MADTSPYLWVLSNRQDDRTVLWERDPAHPGGEAFVGGPSPAYVGRTAEVEGLLRAGLLIDVPEPKAGPKKPIIPDVTTPDEVPDMPGQAVRLGRKLDPDLFPGDTPEEVVAQQKRAGDEVPVPAGVVVPEAPAPERETRRR